MEFKLVMMEHEKNSDLGHKAFNDKMRINGGQPVTKKEYKDMKLFARAYQLELDRKKRQGKRLRTVFWIVVIVSMEVAALYVIEIFGLWIKLIGR